MKTKEEIIALLVALGKTSDEVSNSLIEKGIKGYKHLCRSCPIATYLLDNGVDLARGVGSMMGKRGWFWIGGEMYLLADHPELQGVIAFINNFDQDFYPQCLA